MEMEYLTSLRETHLQKMKPLNVKFQGEYFSFFVYQVCLTVCPRTNKAKDNFGTETVF